MSFRVTRSAARLAAESSNTAAPDPIDGAPQSPAASRKRKAPLHSDLHTEELPTPLKVSPLRPKKKPKITEPEPLAAVVSRSRRAKAKLPAAMSNPGPSPGPTADRHSPPPNTSKRKSSRGKKPGQDSSVPVPTIPTTRRSKKTADKRNEDTLRKDTDSRLKSSAGRRTEHPIEKEPSDDEDSPEHKRYEDEDEDDDDDSFRSGFLGRPGGPAGGISSTLRALSGMVSGISSRLRDILNNLRQKNDPSVQLIALQELSEILLVSTEDNLSGHFSPDQFVKELVTLMQPSEHGVDNPEIMLLACRCIANLMEALPSSTSSVVYGGAVPILCQKLLEIDYIDLAEQALSAKKISVEYPASIVREGGLTACLTYLDFFATSTQRTAVTTAANCCRNIPEDSFSVIRDVMPVLLNVLGSNDQKVVEQGCLCVSRVVESFKYQHGKLEELISADLLKAILRLLLPGTTNLIGPNIHTNFLMVLAITARASPTLSVELFKMNVVDTLFQILTGVSPPSGIEDVALKIDSVMIMQALIHRPREQVYETLNVICELLPGVQSRGLSFHEDTTGNGFLEDSTLASRSRSKSSPNAKRTELLKGCEAELKRFAIILLPTLTDAYSSTVNFSVRQKVLTAQLKMLSNLDTTILEDALRAVPYASYLASILSQQDHPSLVVSALQAAELLLVRLEPIYRYQFYREGVIAEILNLAKAPTSLDEAKPKKVKIEPGIEISTKSLAIAPKGITDDQRAEKTADVEHSDEGDSQEVDDEVDSDDDDDDDDDDEDVDDDDDDHEPNHDDMFPSARTSSSSDQHRHAPPNASNMQDYVMARAKKFLEVHESTRGVVMREKASAILHDLQNLAKQIEQIYLGNRNGDAEGLFIRLAGYFEGDALESMTSSELLNSEIVRVLLDVFSNHDEALQGEARTKFLEIFMGTSIRADPPIQSSNPTTTAFSALVHKLQDLLSREEHFEVVTVHNNSLDSNQSGAAMMLAKQLRLKLLADDDSEIPRPYRSIIVSIHAIANFKNLDDYLRPRISLSERPRGTRHREGVANALAAFAAVSGIPHPHQRLAERGLLNPGEPSPMPTPSSSGTTTRVSRKLTKPKSATAPPATQKENNSFKEKPAATRRSSRKHQSSVVTPQATPTHSTDQMQHTLECVDERQLTDEDDLDDGSALDAIVDDLQDEMDVEHVTDPTAVNMEVASSGKVTARKEDGTRVATPSQGSLASGQGLTSLRTRTSPTTGPNPVLSSRSMSYAAAIQAVPQDWHIEFSIYDQPITSQTTIYRAVHSNREEFNEPSGRNIWSATHQIKFKRVSGPPPPELSLITPSHDKVSDAVATAMPASLNQHPTTSIILRLLNILHELNANLDDVLEGNEDTVKLKSEPLSRFVNTKLTAKLNRQLEEPLIVASSCLPNWSEDLARLYPFLFPFETRHLFLQSTSFGYSRSMARWQNTQTTEDTRRDRHRDDRPFLGRLQRQKVRISRTRILESAVKVMELYGASPSVLEVEYFEEVGTGLGPTLEFYSTVSKEFSKKKIKLWRENESPSDDEYAFGKLGLFPAPMSAVQAEHESGKRVLHHFKMLGKFVARSMLDSRIIDISFNPTFFRIGDGPSTVTPSLGAVKTVDSDLARSLKLVKQFASAQKKVSSNPTLTAAQKTRAFQGIEVQGIHVEDLGLDFTLPGYPSIEMVDNGTNVPVTIENVGIYAEKVIDFTLGSGVQRQVDAFRAGFSQVFPYSALRAFTPNELVMLFGRIEEDWSIETLMDSIKADHGFNMDSRSVRNLLQTMSELRLQQRRDFLQFVTGSPKLPIGGFKSLTPMFTVVCKPSEPPYTSDDYLPSVMTCVNYLKLPDYTNLDVMRERLNKAINEGQGAFHLS